VTNGKAGAQRTVEYGIPAYRENAISPGRRVDGGTDVAHRISREYLVVVSIGGLLHCAKYPEQKGPKGRRSRISTLPSNGGLANRTLGERPETHT